MKELQLNYYFNHINEFFAPELFENCQNIWEPLSRINDFLNQKVIQPGLKENLADTRDFVSITGNYFIDEGTKIGANVSIEGPVYIGKNVTIQSGALLRPGTIIGDGAVIGHACEAKHCIIQNNAKVQSFTFCGDSLIGKSTRIGSGTILANRRFDQSNIILKVNGEKIATDTDFFGAIIGDNTRLGANCTSTPGTLIGPYTWIMPTVQARNFIPAEKRVFPPTDLTITDNPRLDLKN